MPKTNEVVSSPSVKRMKTTALVDELGELKALLSEGENRAKELSTEIIKRAGNKPFVEGDLFSATIVAEAMPYPILDSEKIKEEMDAKWISRHSKMSKGRSAYVKVTARLIRKNAA